MAIATRPRNFMASSLSAYCCAHPCRFRGSHVSIKFRMPAIRRSFISIECGASLTLQRRSRLFGPNVAGHTPGTSPENRKREGQPEDEMAPEVSHARIGQPVRRKEDLRLTTGRGSFSDDMN